MCESYNTFYKVYKSTDSIQAELCIHMKTFKQNVHKEIVLPFFLLLTMFGMSCNSTRITTSWKEPDKQIRIVRLHKILVVALLNNETNRRIAEDQMVSFMKGKGIASYNYVDADFNKKNEKALQKKIKLDGFDGAITMRLLDVDKDTMYRPGSFTSYPDYYRSFDGYYARSFEVYTTPGIYSTTKTYTIQTNVFSVKEDKIIWSGITRSINPKGVDKMTGEISKAVYKKMIKEGFLTKE